MTTGMEREIVNIPMTSNEFKLPFKLQAGHSYSADLRILKGEGVSSEPYASSNSVFFRAGKERVYPADNQKSELLIPNSPFVLSPPLDR